MTTNETREVALEEPLAGIERHLIAAYVAGTGHDLQELLKRPDADAKTLLADASRYASDKLSEIEARSHYLHSLRGEA
jgi:hypothetical protein